MCTALCFQTKDCYFGRNLDLDCSYGEEVCVMPRRFSVKFRQMGVCKEHFAIIGMATVVSGEPLFYDAVNEYGLGMAGLNFPNNAYYPSYEEGKDNVTPFEFIPWILGRCKTLAEAKILLNRLNLVGIAYSEKLPLSPLHFILSDGADSIVIEPMRGGLRIHENPVGVLTNNPPFAYHLSNLNNYRNLKNSNGENCFAKGVALESYCQGLGAVGLPGDLSSPSRFVRVAFHKFNAVCEEDENASVSQVFHLLASVEMPRGSCKTPSEKYDFTVYSACVNMSRGRYYYVTYDNRQINCVDMRRCNLDGEELCRFPLLTEGGIRFQN